MLTQLKAGFSATAQMQGDESGPTVSELAERIKALKAANTIEAAPQRVRQKHSSAEEPVTARIRRRTEAPPVSEPAIPRRRGVPWLLMPHPGRNGLGDGIGLGRLVLAAIGLSLPTQMMPHGSFADAQNLGDLRVGLSFVLEEMVTTSSRVKRRAMALPSLAWFPGPGEPTRARAVYANSQSES